MHLYRLQSIHCAAPQNGHRRISRISGSIRHACIPTVLPNHVIYWRTPKGFLLCFSLSDVTLPWYYSSIPLLINLLASTFNMAAIFISISNEGWLVLEHHRETVASFFPNCPANHFPVLPCSTNTIFNRFIFSVSIFFCLTKCDNRLMIFAKIVIKDENE